MKLRSLIAGMLLALAIMLGHSAIIIYTIVRGGRLHQLRRLMKG